MLTLIHAPRSRSSGFIWMLEEFAQPYQIDYVTIRRADGSIPLKQRKSNIGRGGMGKAAGRTRIIVALIRALHV